MDEDYIRFLLLQDFLDTIQYVCGDIKQRLAVLHDIEIIVWSYVEGLEDLIQHLSVLGCYA